MFSGIIEATGVIETAEEQGENLRLTVTSQRLGMDDVRLGDSIAVNGVCLTVVSLNEQGFSADVSPETLRCTCGLELGSAVNLEKAMRYGDRVGGHLVSGHVDGVGQVTQIVKHGDHWQVEFEAPAELARFIARKGSIAVNGVSLTVNRVDNARFEVNLIPHTWSVTTLELLDKGSNVNLEIDMLARYLERMLAEQPQ
jgi:riboflavin synthase